MDERRFPSIVPKPGAPTPGASLIPGLERRSLPNGLEVISIRREGVPLATVEIAIRAGGFIETPDLNGLTHLHEHMFFKANRAIPDQAAYLRRLDELGASWNGSTSDEVVRYFFTVPARLLEEGLEFLRDAIQFPLFLPEELERERKVVLGEYDRNEATPSFHVHRALDRAMFPAHFSRKNVIGDRGVIASATPEKLRFIQDGFYVPNNAALVIAGEFEEGRARRAAEALFGGWPRRPDPFLANPIPRHPPMERDAFTVVERDVRSATVLLGWHGPSVGEDPDGAVAADVATTAMNHPASRFHRALVDSGLAAEAVASYYTLNCVGPITVRLETTPAKALDAIAAARRELDLLAGPGYLDAEEISRAAARLIVDETYSRQKAREFAIALGFWWSVGGVDLYLRYFERTLAVTGADVIAFARCYLPGGGTRTAAAIMVSPSARGAHGIDPQAAALAFERGRAAPGAGAPPAPLRTSPPAPPPIASPGRTAPRSPARDAEAIDLPGGSRLIFRRLPGAEVADFALHFRGHPERSRAEEAGLEGLLLGTLADGLERAHPDELSRLGARVRCRTRGDYSTIAVGCLRENFDRAADLLAGWLIRAELRPEDVERNRARMVDARSRMMDDPDDAVGFVADRTFLPPGHPYLGYPGGTEESLPRLGIEALRARRALLLTGRRILVTVVGDVDPAGARAAAERAAGGLPAGEPPSFALPPLAGPPGAFSVEERSIPTCYLMGKFRAPAPGEDGFEALSLALSILHREMFLEVRTRRALTYAVASGIGERARNSGHLYVTTTRPEEALAAMLWTVEGLIARPPREAEFRASARTFITRQLLRRESPAEQAESLALEEIVAGDWRRSSTVSARIEDLEPADVSQALRDHVRGIHYGVIGDASRFPIGKLTSSRISGEA